MAGREAVLLFFALSGFVLALPYLSGRDRSYEEYAIRRVFRIYLPYIVAVALGFAGYTLLARGYIPGMSDWFQSHWNRPITSRDVANHVGMLGRFRASDYGLAFWSLVHEMRISLVFPFLLIPVLRWRTSAAVAVAGAFSLAGIMWAYIGGLKLGDGSIEYAVSVHLVGIFLMGALLAKHRREIASWINSLSVSLKLLYLMTGAALYVQARTVTDLFGENAIAQGVEHWGIAAGAAIFITFLVSSARAARAMSHRSLLFLGRISYSLYLLHAIVLYAAVHALSPYLPLWLVLALVPPVAIAVAALSARYVEQPSMVIGKALSERFARRRRTASPRRIGRSLERARLGATFGMAYRSSL